MNDNSLIPVGVGQVSVSDAPNSQFLIPNSELIRAAYLAALDGLYKAYSFGALLLNIQESITRDDTRVTAGNDFSEMHGWNAGSGLKGYLAKQCPEIAYHTARRFIKVADNVHRALAQAGLPVTEENVRAYIEGKSQRQLLKAPEEEKPLSLAASTAERAAKLAETMEGYTRSLEGMIKTGETLILTPESRREIILRLKALTRKLEDEMN